MYNPMAHHYLKLDEPGGILLDIPDTHKSVIVFFGYKRNI